MSKFLNSKSKKILFFFVTIVLVIVIILFFSDFIYLQTSKIDEVKLKLDDNVGENIYIVSNKNDYEVDDLRFQNLIDKKIKYMLFKKNYTFDNPLVILNPYNTNTLSFNIYFKTNDSLDLNYNISVDDKLYNDYSNISKGYKVTHNYYGYQITGLVVGEDNNIKLTLKNKDKIIKEKNIKIKLEEAEGKEEKFPILSYEPLEVNRKINEELLENGLYLANSHRVGAKGIGLYDNNGIIRANLFHKRMPGFNISFLEDYIVYPYSDTNFLKMNALGKIVNTYKLEGYRMHHDYTYNKYNNKLTMLADVNPRKDIMFSTIVSLDLNTGKVELIADFDNLLPEMKEEASKYTKYSTQEPLDCFHVNSVAIVNENDILVSSRELSTIVYLENAYTAPKIKYLICDESVFENTKYKDLVLKKESNFYAHAGQHSLTYTKDEKNKDCYYITLFNNAVEGAYTRPNFDWKNYGELSDEKNGKGSKIYVYHVNEKNKSYNLVKEFEIPFSSRQGNVQKLNNNYIITSEWGNLIGEYDNNGNLLKEFKGRMIPSYKYNFKYFWFK